MRKSKTQTGLIVAIISGLGLLTAGWAAPVSAQNENAASRTKPICLVRPSANLNVAPSRIIAPEAARKTLEGKGFEEFVCGKVGFSLPEQIRYRELVCKIAHEETEGMQRQFEGILGERPAVLCAMAELVLGERPNPRGLN